MAISKEHLKSLKDIKDLCEFLKITPQNLYISNNCICGFSKENEIINFYAASEIDSNDAFIMYDYLVKDFGFNLEDTTNGSIYTLYRFMPIYIKTDYKLSGLNKAFNMIIEDDFITNHLTKNYTTSSNIEPFQRMDKAIKDSEKELFNHRNERLEKEGFEKAIAYTEITFRTSCTKDIYCIRIKNPFGGI
ncbi:hypothetical protein ACSW9V_15290 (plasmid) [Clostridium perfringens]|nr:hypothetical protein [Clostridium perfringens]EGT0693852.1 hypothetical protein [Clostridium perfringens]EGT0696904.1 hypothetical protein [Clostridium perfringens]MDU3376247.1 hypothetical protein [Clostridium perfringens]MDU3534203.1 hypothetical protein [Clostridium perfringens]